MKNSKAMLALVLSVGAAVYAEDASQEACEPLSANGPRTTTIKTLLDPLDHTKFFETRFYNTSGDETVEECMVRYHDKIAGIIEVLKHYVRLGFEPTYVDQHSLPRTMSPIEAQVLDGEYAWYIPGMEQGPRKQIKAAALENK